MENDLNGALSWLLRHHRTLITIGGLASLLAMTRPNRKHPELKYPAAENTETLSHARSPSMAASLAAFERFYWKKCLKAVLVDLLTAKVWLPGWRRLRTHEERLTEFEAYIPEGSLSWVAEHADPKVWAALYAEKVRDIKPEQGLRLDTTVEKLVLLTGKRGEERDSWQARLDLIDGATESVLVQYAYIYLDWYGWTFCEHLKAAAQRGCQVKVMLDEFGAESFVFGGQNPHHPPCPGTRRVEYVDMEEMLLKAGVQMSYWRGISSLDRQEFPTKNHIKTLIIDNKYAILGDRNIGIEYYEDWSGADILLEGEGAAALAQTMDCMTPMIHYRGVPGWSAEDADDAGIRHAINMPDSCKVARQRLAANAMDALPSHRASGSISAQVLCHVPTASGYDVILHTVVEAIRGAKKSIDIRSCYVIFGGFLQHELILAHRRGVRVRILTNSFETCDLPFIYDATVHSLIAPAEAGCQVYMTRGTVDNMDHSKFIVVDSQWLCLGSWNCWLRTHFYEAEANVVVTDPAIGKTIVEEQVDHHLRPELVKSGAVELMTPDTLKEDASKLLKKHPAWAMDRFHERFTDYSVYSGQ